LCGTIQRYLSGLILLTLVEGKEGDTRDLDDLEATSGNITLGVTGTTETGAKDFIVLIDVVKATISRDEGGDLLAVLDELNADSLTNGRVGLLGLNADLLGDDALSVGSTSEGGL
jgi:hypothetical protein